MNVRQRVSVFVGLPLILAGCIATDDRSGNRSVTAENGFWCREGLAVRRLLASPLPLVYGVCETGEELGVGLIEMFCGCQFKGCAYPWERQAYVAAASKVSVAGDPVRVASALSSSVSDGKADSIDMKICTACVQGNWQEAARLSRQSFSKSENALQLMANGLRLAMVNWNADDQIGAIIAMDTVVSTCGDIGPECEAMAVGFRNEFRAGTLPKRFSVEEVTEMVGIRKVILEMAEKESSLRK